MMKAGAKRIRARAAKDESIEDPSVGCDWRIDIETTGQVLRKEEEDDESEIEVVREKKMKKTKKKSKGKASPRKRKRGGQSKVLTCIDHIPSRLIHGSFSAPKKGKAWTRGP